MLGMVWDSEWAESAQCEPVSLPLVVPGEMDVLLTERGEVRRVAGIRLPIRARLPRCN